MVSGVRPRAGSSRIDEKQREREQCRRQIDNGPHKTYFPGNFVPREIDVYAFIVVAENFGPGWRLSLPQTGSPSSLSTLSPQVPAAVWIQRDPNVAWLLPFAAFPPPSG